MFLNNKKIDDVLYKKANNELSDKNKDISQEAKKLFDLRVEIYKKLVLEEENLKFEKSVGDTVKFKHQKDNLSETPEQKEFNNSLEQIKEEQKAIDVNLFKDYFDHVAPTVLVKTLFETKDINKNNELVKLIKVIWSNLKDEATKMSKEKIENKKPGKIFKIVEEIVIFNRENQKQQGLDLKILTPNQMLSRLPIF